MLINCNGKNINISDSLIAEYEGTTYTSFLKSVKQWLKDIGPKSKTLSEQEIAELIKANMHNEIEALT